MIQHSKSRQNPFDLFYRQEQAEELSSQKGFVCVEDSGRGYRCVVASSMPVDIVQKDAIEAFVDQMEQYIE